MHIHRDDDIFVKMSNLLKAIFLNKGMDKLTISVLWKLEHFLGHGYGYGYVYSNGYGFGNVINNNCQSILFLCQTYSFVLTKVFSLSLCYKKTQKTISKERHMQDSNS